MPRIQSAAQGLAPHRKGSRKKRKPNNGAPRWKMQERCHQDLMAHGVDCRIHRLQLDVQGNRVMRPSILTHVVNGTRASLSHFEFKPTWRLPYGEFAAFKKIRLDLKHYLKSNRNIWMGVATFGKRCAIGHVKDVWKDAMPQVHQFFEEIQRNHPVQHLFSIVEDTVRDKRGRTCKAGNKSLRHHVHVHFLIHCDDGQDLTAAPWYPRFLKRFGKGSGVLRIKGKAKTVSYLLKPLERADLIKHGEFHAWFNAVEGLRRFSIYGPLKAAIKKREARSRKVIELSATKRLRVVPAPKKPKLERRPRGPAPAVVMPDQHLVKKRSKNAQGDWVSTDIFRNVQGPVHAIFHRTGVPEDIPF